MKILAPLAAENEVEPLLEAGADEFYCGLFPAGWFERWGRGAWPNRRGPGPANLERVDEVESLSKAVRAGEKANDHGKAEIYLALNQQFYTDDQAAFLLEITTELHRKGAVDAWIVTSPGLLSLLRQALPGIRLFASTVSVAMNSEAIAFLHEELGCERVILSRHLHLDEIRAIKQAVPDVALEVFLLNDNCYFEEGFCSTTHSTPGFGVYCMTPWDIEVRRGQGQGLPISQPEERARWDFLIEEHQHYLRGLSHRGHGGGRNAVPLGPCGLCSIPALMDLGIDSGKIVGREASLYRKLRSVQSVRYLRDSYQECKDPREVKRRAIELRADPRGCSDGFSCYYRGERDRDLIPLPSRPRGPRRERSPKRAKRKLS